jgi:hypothetical protein
MYLEEVIQGKFLLGWWKVIKNKLTSESKLFFGVQNECIVMD